MWDRVCNNQSWAEDQAVQLHAQTSDRNASDPGARGASKTSKLRKLPNWPICPPKPTGGAEDAKRHEELQARRGAGGKSSAPLLMLPRPAAAGP
eukprot:2688043-Pyramimonas_sp.AAC.2